MCVCLFIFVFIVGQLVPGMTLWEEKPLHEVFKYRGGYVHCLGSLSLHCVLLLQSRGLCTHMHTLLPMALLLL